MKSQISKEMLVDTPEAKAEVSTDLHQNIMRAVRQATAHDQRAPSAWRFRPWALPVRAVPIWSTGIAVLALAVFYLAQTAPPIPTPEPQAQSATLAQTQKISATVTLVGFSDKLALFSKDSLLPEKELIEEYERLKSDLERLGFRS